MLSTLMLAAISSMVPGFGLLGSIVEFISSENPNAGKKFVLELATVGLPGGILTSLGTELVGELLLGSQVPYAVSKITPYQKVVFPCSRCKNYSNYYVKQGGKIICSNCLSRQISTSVSNNDKIYLIGRNVRHLHSALKQANYLYGQTLKSNKLGGKSLNGRKL